MKTKIQNHSEDRELNQARSKPDAAADWSVRPAHTIVTVAQGLGLV